MGGARYRAGAAIATEASRPGSRLLIIGGWLSLVAALLHIGVILGGPDWYRFFGAGEEMAKMAEQGMLYPTILTSGIVLVLAIWSYYAFAGAGRVKKPPLLRIGLITISTIYLLRGLGLLPLLIFKPDLIDSFAIWSSLIVLTYGLFYSVGTWNAWPILR